MGLASSTFDDALHDVTYFTPIVDNTFQIKDLPMLRSTLLVASFLVLSINSLRADVATFREDFVSDPAGWVNAGFGALSFSSTGGPDGVGDSFVTGERNFFSSPNNFATTIIRGHDSLNSSSDAFVGNWIASGITEFKYFVRHNASVPLTFAARFASPLNSPGANAEFGLVGPGVWTELTFDVSADSTQFTSFEGSTYEAVFSNIGNIQLTARPDALLGVDQTVTFDFDKIAIVPEASSMLLISIAMTGGGLVMFGKRRARI